MSWFWQNFQPLFVMVSVSGFLTFIVGAYTPTNAHLTDKERLVANIVDTLDGTLSLYAPLVARWMIENPSFEGIDLRLDGDGPIACPKDRQGSWYDAPEFETMAASELKNLVEATHTLAAECPIAQGNLRHLSISSWRHGETVMVYAKVSHGLGGVRAERNAIVRNDGLLAYTPADFILSTDIQPAEEQVAALKAAAEQGPQAAVRHMVETGTILHWNREQGEEAARWFAAFPAPADAKVVDHFGVKHELVIQSNQEPTKVLVPRSLMNERADLEGLLRERNIAFEIFDDGPAAVPMTDCPQAGPAVQGSDGVSQLDGIRQRLLERRNADAPNTPMPR